MGDIGPGQHEYEVEPLTVPATPEPERIDAPEPEPVGAPNE